MPKEDFDPIMEEVYATRRKISMQFGNDPSRYIAAIREEIARAKSLGMTYREYCLAQLEDKLPLCACEEAAEYDSKPKTDA